MRTVYERWSGACHNTVKQLLLVSHNDMIASKEHCLHHRPQSELWCIVQLLFALDEYCASVFQSFLTVPRKWQREDVFSWTRNDVYIYCQWQSVLSKVAQLFGLFWECTVDCVSVVCLGPALWQGAVKLASLQAVFGDWRCLRSRRELLVSVSPWGSDLSLNQVDHYDWNKGNYLRMGLYFP